MRVLFAVTNYFYDDDLTKLFELFDREYKFNVKIATPKGLSVTGIHGTKVLPDYALDDIAPYRDNFDVLVLVSYYDIDSFNSTEFKEFVKAMLDNKTVVALRSSPLFLAREGIIRGLKTSWDYISFPQLEEQIREWGAFPMKVDYFIDRNYISSRGCCYDVLFSLAELNAKRLV